MTTEYPEMQEILQGMGQFFLLSLIILVIFIVLWALLFQNMRMKYTKVDE